MGAGQSSSSSAKSATAIAPEAIEAPGRVAIQPPMPEPSASSVEAMTGGGATIAGGAVIGVGLIVGGLAIAGALLGPTRAFIELELEAAGVEGGAAVTTGVAGALLGPPREDGTDEEGAMEVAAAQVASSSSSSKGATGIAEEG